MLAAERGKVGERYILGCKNMTLLEIAQTLEIDEGAVECEPVEHFIEQTGVVTRPKRAGQEEALGIDDAIGAGVPTVAGDAEGTPRPPQPVEQGLDDLGPKVGWQHGGIRGA